MTDRRIAWAGHITFWGLTPALFAALWAWRNPHCGLGQFVNSHCPDHDAAALLGVLYMVAASIAAFVPSLWVRRWLLRRRDGRPFRWLP